MDTRPASQADIECRKVRLRRRQYDAQEIVVYGRRPELETSRIAAEDIPLEIIYEDEDLLVVNKPAGLVVHPAPGNYSGTLVNALLGRGGAAAYGGIAGVRRPGRNSSASAAKSSPAFSRSTTVLASSSVSTRMCLTCTCSSVVGTRSPSTA